MISILCLSAREDLYGASRALLAVCEKLGGHGFQPLLVTPVDGALQSLARKVGLRTHTAPVGSARSLAARLAARATTRALAEWSAAEEVELVVAGSLSAMPFAASVAERLQVPSVLHLRNIYASRGRTSPHRKYGASRADLIIAASRFILDECETALPRVDPQLRCVVFDGIDPAEPTLDRATARQALGLDPAARYAAIVGALSPQKGTLFAARAVAQIPSLELVVLGDGSGPYAEAVRASPRTRCLGFRADARALLPAFDLLLHPSEAEAYGLAPLEAMAAGVPVIASRVGGLPEALGDAAELLPASDEGAWTGAIVALLGDAARWTELRARGLAHAPTRSAALAAERTAVEYRQLLAQGQLPASRQAKT